MEEEQKKVSGAAALPKVGWKGMLALAFGILFFAGVFATVQGAEWLKAFDYSTLIGKFGTMKDPAKATFVGMGGVSARGGFICLIAHSFRYVGHWCCRRAGSLWRAFRGAEIDDAAL